MPHLIERQTRWDVHSTFVLPDLSDLAAGGDVERDVIDTVSSYHDTAAADLQACGILLRRDDGDDGTGWVLSLADATELRWPLSDTAPAEVTDLLAGVTGGATLHNIGTVHTVRHRHRINAVASDVLVAEIAEDRVRASNSERLLAWKQIGVELGPAAERPARIQKLLRKAGATPARYPSALSHLSGVAPPAPAVGPATQALTDYINDQVDAIVAGDIAFRRRLDPVHNTRVALRRLRSTLRVFTPLLRHDAVTELDADLKWYAGLLGEVRDCQVQHHRLGAALDELSDELTLGPVRSRLRADLQAIELPARKEVRSAMDSPRYLGMLSRLRAWRTAAPLVDVISESALRRRADKAARTADRRLSAALETGEDTLLHPARKAVKRARYAAELVGRKRTAKRYKKIQGVLGDHQDTVVAREILRRTGAAAGSTDGENGFTFGLLYAREQARASACHRQLLRLQ